jgi:tRNA(Arg) A34 adenosine deaminase TadA
MPSNSGFQLKKKFMQLAIAEAKRAGDRGDYPIGAVPPGLQVLGEVVIASAGNRVKTSGSSIKHVELETLKYVSSGYAATCSTLCSTRRMSPVLCAPAPACGVELGRWSTESRRKT